MSTTKDVAGDNSPIEGGPVTTPDTTVSLHDEPVPRPAPHPPRGSSSNSQPKPCIVCKRKPQYSHGGKLYPTCGLTCAAELQVDDPSQLMCVVCHNRRRHFNGVTTYPTCGMTCAARLESGHITDKPSINKRRPVRDDGASLTTNSTCLLCWKARKENNSDFCGPVCVAAAEQLAPLLLEIPRGHITFHGVDQRFKSTWQEDAPCPELTRVYKIVESPDEQPLRELEISGRFPSSGEMGPHHWHGAPRKCLVGDAGHDVLCDSETCPLCLIIRNPFDIMRFVRDISTSRASSRGIGAKTMLLMNIISGQMIESEHGTTLAQKPSRRSSVNVLFNFPSLLNSPKTRAQVCDTSESSMECVTNLDESTTFAMRPLFLVVYN